MTLPDEQHEDGFELGRLSGLQREALGRIESARHLEDLEKVEAELLGRNSMISELKRALGGLATDERPAAGMAINAARDEITVAIAQRRRALEDLAREARLREERLDLTEFPRGDGPGHLHLVTKVRDELEDIFLGMGYEIAEGPEIETEWYNFTALNMPRDHPARSIQDSFYLSHTSPDVYLLRSQTSPVQIRLLERAELPIYAVAPGRVYRRDTADARHLPVFHQIEGIVIDKNVTFGDLAGTIDTFVKQIFGEQISSRLRPAYFPFTEPSAEFEITCTICSGAGCRTCGQTGWIELGGCGMVHPAVLRATGIDPEIWTGFAFGFGIDRIAIMRYGIDDLRSLIENDVRFLRQF